MTDKPTTRKDLMKPVQLLGLAFVAALFAGFVTLMSMGFFQTRPADQIQRALIVALVAAGATFIIVLVSVALMLLAVDPSKVTATVDRPLLLPKDAPDATPGASAERPATRAEGAAPGSATRSEGAVPPRPDDDGAAPRA
ncbi:amino acid transporter [Microbacterium sp. KSW4-17]|uniref:Amino acid transporter n=1 Tax=Microbacterium galbum TaxID=3075994 RepID=A0ABU3T6K5_9MICO|nr:amino acid transporter [Microbacterium sp. KSW4-17]MDU0367009.1 amino acid transporter [Microbacterium sp. KSW4-17]